MWNHLYVESQIQHKWTYIYETETDSQIQSPDLWLQKKSWCPDSSLIIVDECGMIPRASFSKN